MLTRPECGHVIAAGGDPDDDAASALEDMDY